MGAEEERDDAPESTRQPIDALVTRAPEDARAPRRSLGPVPPPPPLPPTRPWVEGFAPTRGRR